MKKYQCFAVMVNRHDGLTFEKLEPNFKWVSHNPKQFAPDGVTEIFEKHIEEPKELTEKQVTEFNKESEKTGLRYYEI